jgi:hypothetical protein
MRYNAGMKWMLAVTVMIQGCGFWGAKDYNRQGTLLLIEGSDCRVTYSDGKVYGGPGMSTAKEHVDLHQGVDPR